MPDGEDQGLEEEREVVGGDAPREDGPAAAAAREDDHRGQRSHEAGQGQGRRRRPPALRGEGLGQQHDDAGERHHDGAGTSGRRSRVAGVIVRPSPPDRFQPRPRAVGPAPRAARDFVS